MASARIELPVWAEFAWPSPRQIAPAARAAPAEKHVSLQVLSYSEFSLCRQRAGSRILDACVAEPTIASDPAKVATKGVWPHIVQAAAYPQQVWCFVGRHGDNPQPGEQDCISSGRKRCRIFRRSPSLRAKPSTLNPKPETRNPKS